MGDVKLLQETLLLLRPPSPAHNSDDVKNAEVNMTEVESNSNPAN